MRKQLIVGAKALGSGGELTPRNVLIENGKILDADYRNSQQIDAEIFDARGAYLLPSFIELHAHGGGGCDFGDLTRESFDTVMNTHLAHGVTLLCPTLVTCPWEELVRFLAFCENEGRKHFMFGGTHLEGPFLSTEKCGAQNLSHLISPTEDKIATLEEFSSVIARVTAAPEVDGVLNMASRLNSCGVQMSVGHSAALAPDMERAADAGFTQITHLFSSTTGRTKIGSYVLGGIEECSLIDDRFTVELIGDGHHVSRESLLLVSKCKGKDGVFIVSDAMRAAGESAETTESYIGKISPDNRVIIEDGVAKLPDRSSFAGSIGVGDTMVRALCANYGLPLATVSRMMSEVPARLLGLEGKRGRVENGFDAELTLLDANYRTVAVFSHGDTFKFS